MQTLQHEVSFDRSFAQTQMQLMKQESSSVEAKKARNLLQGANNMGAISELGLTKNNSSIHNSHDWTASANTTQNTYYNMPSRPLKQNE